MQLPQYETDLDFLVALAEEQFERMDIGSPEKGLAEIENFLRGYQGSVDVRTAREVYLGRSPGKDWISIHFPLEAHAKYGVQGFRFSFWEIAGRLGKTAPDYWKPVFEQLAALCQKPADRPPVYDLWRANIELRAAMDQVLDAPLQEAQKLLDHHDDCYQESPHTGNREFDLPDGFEWPSLGAAASLEISPVWLMHGVLPELEGLDAKLRSTLEEVAAEYFIDFSIEITITPLANLPSLCPIRVGWKKPIARRRNPDGASRVQCNWFRFPVLEHIRRMIASMNTRSTSRSRGAGSWSPNGTY